MSLRGNESGRAVLWLVVAFLLFVSVAGSVSDLLVIGVDIDATDPRAYPLEIMNYHEIVNDVIGGKHVAITWAPLTYSNMVIETEALLPYVQYQISSNRLLIHPFCHQT